MEHYFETEGGYSGSPLIVKFHDESFGSYIVAVHRGLDRDGKTVSVKMTEEIVERLIELERKLRNSELSYIKISSVEFERCLEKAEKARAEQSRLNNQHSRQQKTNSNINKILDQLNLETSRGDCISRGKLREMHE